MAEGTIKNKLLQIFKGDDTASLNDLAPKLARMPAERSLFVMGVGAGLAGLSFKTAKEYFRVAPEVGRLLNTFELKTWGELGKRLAATNIEAANDFFVSSSETLAALPSSYRLRVLTLCTRQASLSTRVAVESFKLLPGVVAEMGDTPVLQRILVVSNEVARHSVKHSCDLLRHAPHTAEVLNRFESPDGPLTTRVLELTASFVHRSGGTAAEFFLAVPESLNDATYPNFPKLLDHTSLFLDRSGGLALQYFRAAGRVLALAGRDAFEQWTRFSFVISAQGNASAYQFLQLSPKVVAALAADKDQKQVAVTIRGVMDTITEIAHYNVGSAIECFKAGPQALRRATLDQFRTWALKGLELYGKDPRSAQAYYALQSRTSRETLTGRDGAVTLERIAQVLRLYVEGLTGRSLTVSPLNAMPEQARIGDGKTVYLPSHVADFPDEESNFRLYKVLAAHSAGQLEYGTHEADTPELKAVQAELFDEFRNAPRKRSGVDYSVVLKHFPNQDLAGRVFTTLENGRIDRRLRRAYRGIRRDLDFVGARLKASRPRFDALTQTETWLEILFQIALCGGPTDEARREWGPIVGRLEGIVADYLEGPDAGVADTIQAVRKVYGLIREQSVEHQSQSDRNENASENQGETGAGDSSDENSEESPSPYKTQNAPMPRSESFDFWAAERSDTSPPLEDLISSIAQDRQGTEYQLDPSDKAFFYDEWDRELADFRLNWCRVIERRNPVGSRMFVEICRARHRGVISSIRRQFQMMKPEDLRKIRGELDGEDFDLEAVIANKLDRRTSGAVNERLYIQRLRRRRDVAVTFLLDMSSSTARTISRFPNQPYTRPGQRIIDLEKEGLVLMSEALEAVGDRYSIYGFTSEGRRNVYFYVIKDFHEQYCEDIEKRVGGVTYQNNTRLGAAVRHAAARLNEQDARTKLLILLSDGRPYDHDYGDARYAREDTKIALRQAQTLGITSFCITIDREGERELKDLYGEVGYTIIDDILSLPERLPGIYRRLTT